MDAMLKDPALADDGRRKVEFAATRMPVLQAVAEELGRTRPLDGVRIAACLHVTTETANLCRALVAGGAELALCASNPLSTKDDVAAAIAADTGARVFAVHGCDRETFYRQVDAALAIRPTLVVDDGADLSARILAHRPDLAGGVVGGTEVTSTGVLRLRNMEREGALAWPMLAINDAATKHLFDTATGRARTPSTASCGPPTCSSRGRCSWWSATAGAGAGSPPGRAAWAPGWSSSRSTPSGRSRR